MGARGRPETARSDIKEDSKEEPGDEKDKQKSSRNRQHIEEMEMDAKKEKHIEKDTDKKKADGANAGGRERIWDERKWK